MLMMILPIAGDFLVADHRQRPAIATAECMADRAAHDRRVVMGICLLAFCIGVLAVGKYVLDFGTEGMRGLTFLALVFGSQATIHALRERGRLWGSRPSTWFAASSVLDVLIVSTLAILGFAMAPLRASLVACALVAAVVCSRQPWYHGE